jgi:hypothetical protein
MPTTIEYRDRPKRLSFRLPGLRVLSGFTSAEGFVVFWACAMLAISLSSATAENTWTVPF